MARYLTPKQLRALRLIALPGSNVVLETLVARGVTTSLSGARAVVCRLEDMHMIRWAQNFTRYVADYNAHVALINHDNRTDSSGRKGAGYRRV